MWTAKPNLNNNIGIKEFEDVKYRVPNIDKIRKIGYTPKHGLDDIIKDMM